uniref:Retrovirus-related Pol polyprotein from transposon TNT 1-94 n=1 Tax=Tanacetum cinerariifolium TaxID=118510 RepID=A0A699H2G8_TANCI|nr:retrovirus-related Pol polyprotein from transposon TNT 1-94 [Tanacetum cinerariifolium]
MRNTKEFEAKYNKVKAKLALLSSSALAPSSFSSKNKRLIAESHDLDEEEVSSDDEETEVKAFMSLTDKERIYVGKESARNDEWTKITIKKLTKDTSSCGSKDLVFVKSSTDNSYMSISSTIVSDSLAPDYDSADESSVCITPLLPLKKLDGAEPGSGPKTVKSILKSKSTFKADTLKGITLNKPSPAPARGNKCSLASKTNSAPAGKLKNVNVKDNPSLAMVMKELNELKLQISKKKSSYSKNKNTQQEDIILKLKKKQREGIKPRAKTRYKKPVTSSKQPSMSSKEATKGGSSKAPTGSKTGHSKRRKESSSAMDSNPSWILVSTPVDTEMHKEDQQATSGPTSLGVTDEERANSQLNFTTEVDPRLSAPNDSIPAQQCMDEGTKNTSYDHISAGASSTDIYGNKEEASTFTHGDKEVTSSIIKLEDLAKLVSQIQPSFKDLDSLEDDPVIIVDESKEDEPNAKIEDTSVPRYSSPRMESTCYHCSSKKDLYTADYTQLYDFLKYNQKEVDELKAKQLVKTQDPLALMVTFNNPYTFPVPHQDQPSFNQNYMQQPMPNPEDITDPTTAMNMALALIAKAFKLNYSTPTNNNQRISSNPHNRQIAQSGMNMGQDKQMQMVECNGENQFRKYAGQNVGNLNGYNAVQNVRNQHVLREMQLYIMTQLLIAQKEEAGIQLQAEEFDLMATAADLDEIKEYTELLEPILESHQVPPNDNNVISEVTSMEQSGETIEQHLENVEETRALYDSLYHNLAIEVEKVNMVNRKLKETNVELTTELARFKNQEKLAKFVGDFKSLEKEVDESLAKHKALELEIERLLKAVVSQDIISIVQNNSVVDTSNLQTELERTKKRFEIVSLKRRMNMLNFGMIDNTKTRRPQPRSNTKNDRVPSASKSSCIKNKGVEVEEHHRNLLLSKNKEHMSSACNNIKFNSQNVKSKVVCAMCKQCLISVNHDVIQICLWCVDSGCSKRMTGNLKLLINFVWKFLGTVRFRNDHVAAILGFGDLQWGNILITRVYFVEGLGHNLFSVGQFCDSNLEVAFRRNACFVRNLEGVDLLSGNCTTNLFTINLHDMASASLICLMACASSTKSWFWHQRLTHLNFDTINDLAKNDLVSGLPKFKYHKEHLCPSCEQGKSKRASHPPKPVPNSRQRSKDEAPEVIKTFLKRVTILLQSPVIIIRTDNGTKFINQGLKEYFDSVGISHQVSSVRTPQQNGVVERRNQTLVEAARTMLIFPRAPLFLWAEAIATACFTQNRSIIHRRFNKTPYELINGRKPDISFLHVFEALCYPKNDREDIGKLGAKGGIGFFIGYSADSCAFRIYNRRTKKIIETMNVSFDELLAMAFEQHSSKPRLQSMTFGQISSGLDLTYAPSTITTQQPTEGELDLLFKAMHDDYIGGQPSATLRTDSAAQAQQVRQTSTTSTYIADTAPTPTNSSSQATNLPISSQDVDGLKTQ